MDCKFICKIRVVKGVLKLEQKYKRNQRNNMQCSFSNTKQRYFQKQLAN